MPENIPYADEATLYVLGVLGDKERREFEVHLKNTPELRSLVRALETGTIAMTMAAPHREPPTKIWENIQTAVALEVEKKVVQPAFGVVWLGSGWVVAACLLLGLFVSVFWVNRSLQSPTRSEIAIHETVVPEYRPTNRSATGTAGVFPQLATASNLLRSPTGPLQRLRPIEMAALRQRIAELENQLSQMSQTVTQQQALPGDFNQLTFFNLTTPSPDSAASKSALPSPELQRALLLGLARQFGWLRPVVAKPSETNTKEEKVEDANPAAAHDTVSGVEFVDLGPPQANTQPPSKNNSATEEKTASPPVETVAPPSQPPAISDSQLAEGGTAPSGAIPAFVSSSNLVIAVNSSVVPTGTENFTVWYSQGDGLNLPLGNISVGIDPTVVTVPFFNNQGPMQFTFTVGSGGSNTILGFYNAPVPRVP